MESRFAQSVLLAWRQQLNMIDLFSACAELHDTGHPEWAVVLYQTWLSRNQTAANHAAWFNMGAYQAELGDSEGARQSYLRAIELAPAFWVAHFNLGAVYERLGLPDAALASWCVVAEQASLDNPDERGLRIMALNNLGRVYENRQRFAQALDSLNASLKIEPNQPDVLHHLVFLRAKQCAWPVYAAIDGVDPALMRQSTSALAMIALSDDPAEQLSAARYYVDTKINLNVPQLTEHRAYGHEKLRIGYLSSDFCLHPVSMLTVELFETHDRDHFEVYGFCWSREDGSGLRQRVVNAMDHFIRIDGLSDETAARLIREHEIDVLIDLHGQTLGARPGILAYRPAPIQITYLGLPATTGLPFIDYAVVDRFLVPEEARQYYSEKPLYMPDVYQVSDRKRVNSPIPARQACGLPEKGFVFCSFNNNYKTTPEMFSAWMRILRRTPGSVLWLLADNVWAEANMRKAAAQAGIDGGRLIFAPRALPPDYLARYGVADLFLDTYPFNAGTTANDALWMMLPVLTRSGPTFASRMAGALLTAAGLPELITWNLQDYEEKAVVLANDAQACSRLRAHLQQVRENGVLFDTARFTRNLEGELRRLVGELGNE